MLNFAINATSSSNTDKAVYLKAMADAVATEIGTSVNRTFFGSVFITGVDAFSCQGYMRSQKIRMICIAGNGIVYSIVRDSSGNITYKQLASVS